jgi:host factor-I protein
MPNDIADTIEGPIALTSEHDRTPSVQDDFLQTLVRDKTTVNVFLVSGIRLSGQLAAFDQFAVLLESGPAVQLVFKHAISTVMPVNGTGPARDPTKAPVSGDKPNHSRARVRASMLPQSRTRPPTSGNIQFQPPPASWVPHKWSSSMT